MFEHILTVFSARQHNYMLY